MPELPTGTVTFLFTDLEGSTRLWEEHPDAMREAVTRHDAILRFAVESKGGVVFSAMGDGIAAAFSSAPGALEAALVAQQRLGAEEWSDIGSLRARMGLHTAEGRLRAPGEYVNRPLNRCARLMAVGHGGQVLLSDSTAALTRGVLPKHGELVDLGEHRLRDLDEPIHVFQLEHPDLLRGFPPLRSLDMLPGNLPRQLTTFVGRQRELELLSELVMTRPLVTLTGVGGVGKTRLALQVAADVITEFRDGAWLCEFAPVSDPGALWETLASALGVQPFPGRSLDEAVLEYLAPRRLLVVLDNCEHVLEAAARLVEAVARRCVQVTVMATSREGLAVPGEQTVAVPSLGLPPADGDARSLAAASAVQLFVDRAHDAKHEFELTERNAGPVAQLCRRLDGIPLAIELAAARVRSLTPEDLVSRLDQRFRLLTRGSRAAIERHQTLRNTIDWSYELLTEAEREALNRMSVFAGGCDLAAMEAVLPGGAIDEVEVVDLVTSLVDKSLVLVDDDDGMSSRYRLLETIRQYAAERLEAGEDTAIVRRQHADHYAARAEAAAPRLRGSGQTQWSTAIARDTENYRLALDWAVETASADHALRLVAAFAVHGTTIGYAAMDWAETAIEVRGAVEHPSLAPVTAWAAWGATLRGDLDRAAMLVTRAEQAEQRLRSRDPLVCQARATLAWFSGDLGRAREPAKEWVRVARSCGDRYELAHALIMWASVNQFDDLDGAIADVEEALQVARDGGVASALSIGLAWMAGMLGGSGAPPERVTAMLDEALEIGLEVGDQMAVSQVPFVRGWFAADHDEWPAALRGALDAADAKLSFGDLAMMRPVLGLAAVSFAHLECLEPAVVLLGARGEFETSVAPDSVMEQYTWLDAEIERQLDAEQAANLRARGARMVPAEAVAYAHAEAARVLSET